MLGPVGYWTDWSGEWHCPVILKQTTVRGSDSARHCWFLELTPSAPLKWEHCRWRFTQVTGVSLLLTPRVRCCLFHLVLGLIALSPTVVGVLSVACHPDGKRYLSFCLTLDMHCCQWVSWQQCIKLFTFLPFITFLHLTSSRDWKQTSVLNVLTFYMLKYSLLRICYLYLLPGCNICYSPLHVLAPHFTSGVNPHLFQPRILDWLQTQCAQPCNLLPSAVARLPVTLAAMQTG